MKAYLSAALPCLLALAMGPGVAAAQGVLRGTDPAAAARVPSDPPGVQVTTLSSGGLLKRLPGTSTPGESATPASLRMAPGMAVQQVGNAQMLTMGSPPPAVDAAQQGSLRARQVGKVQVLELPGQRTPGLEASSARADLPAGVVVVDLPAGQPLPAMPPANTLYRRLPATP